MNETLQAKLVEILTGIQEAAKVTGDFAFPQLPDIAQSYVAYGRVVATVQFCVFLALFLIFLYVALRHGLLSKQLNSYGSWPDSRAAACIIGGLAALFAGGVALASAGTMFLVWFAPKVWLLRELAHLIK